MDQPSTRIIAISAYAIALALFVLGALPVLEDRPFEKGGGYVAVAGVCLAVGVTLWIVWIRSSATMRQVLVFIGVFLAVLVVGYLILIAVASVWFLLGAG